MTVATATAPRTNSKVEAAFRERTRKSAALYERARKVIPAGLTHDSRTLLPYPIYAARASGPLKWDVDGNTYVDYFGGHGALLLGHCQPDVVAAVDSQAKIGTHWGSSHELEVIWAELINRMVPSAELVRFTASGTEASHLALRLARGFSGRTKIIRFAGHFHGWHDAVAAGAMSHFDGGVPVGVPLSLAAETILLPTDDVERVEATLSQRDDVAAVILEPSGASWGQVPLPSGFLPRLREITLRHDTLLIFDEVITGFRWSPGGAQKRFAVVPDLTVLAKIVAGGLPGAAVAGRAAVLDQLDAQKMKQAGREKIGHQGTFNANPLSAAAAVTTLSIIESQGVCERAEKTAEQIRAGLRQILVDEDVAWGVYGDASAFQIFQNPGRLPLDPATFDASTLGFEGLKRVRNPELAYRLRIALIANGVDIMGSPGGLVSAAHGPEEVAQTLEAFRTAIRWLKADGDV